jgi:ethanolamine utilization protein EutA
MLQHLLSVGIDIGTTTTQIIFSRITINNNAGASVIPEYKITHKELLYQSKIYLTPLLPDNQIDYAALKTIVADEYLHSGFPAADIDSGAVIITGETARKENANPVVASLADFAGDFVVSTAGPDLEAVLAGWGSGAGEISKKMSGNIVNFDIGGGTTNAGVFFNGEILDTYALDLGGRLIRLDHHGEVTYISNRIAALIASLGLNLVVNQPASFQSLRTLSQRLAAMFLELISRQPLQDDTRELFIGHQSQFLPIETVSFSGGVAEYIYSQAKIKDLNDLIFNDIGPLLGQCIREVMEVQQIQLVEPSEKIRATVIGAGNHTMNISGSTISVSEELLPLKNIPVVKIFDNPSEDIELFDQQLTRKMDLYPDQTVAIAFRGNKSPGFIEVKRIAAQIVAAHANRQQPIIVILEQDFAKALGQTILNTLPCKKPLLCLDHIKVQGGDYIDIGYPVSGVVPVVVKTLIFNT